MTDKTLEQRAREAAEHYVVLVETLSPPRTWVDRDACLEDFMFGYTNAATAREQEVVGLRAKLTEAKAAIRWMHGYDEPGTEDFPICPEGKRYAWRGVSRQQFAIVREACSEPIPLPEGE